MNCGIRTTSGSTLPPAGGSTSLYGKTLKMTGDVGFRADCSEVELILMDKSESPFALNSLEMKLSVG